MKNTGIYATDEERERAFKAVDRAAQTPVIAFSSRHALEDGGLSGQAWKSAKQLCHQFALDHGLPEIDGYYGMTKKGEFVTV